MSHSLEAFRRLDGRAAIVIGAGHMAELASKVGLVNCVDHEMRYSSIYTGMNERIGSEYVGR